MNIEVPRESVVVVWQFQIKKMDIGFRSVRSCLCPCAHSTLFQCDLLRESRVQMGTNKYTSC
jgi:hypothetical protein